MRLIIAVWVALGFGLVPAIIFGGLALWLFGTAVAATVATLIVLIGIKMILFGKKRNG